MPHPLTEEVHQVINPQGEIVGDLPDLPMEKLISLYRWMVLARELLITYHSSLYDDFNSVETHLNP